METETGGRDDLPAGRAQRMRIRAPLRISFFGGGSDLPMYRELTGSGGCVLSCTIDHAVTVRTPAAQRGCAYDVSSAVPPGSGLGGSGALHVAQALHDRPRLSGHALFHDAWHRETAMNRYSGWQDVAAATFGGLNRYTYADDVRVESIPIPPDLHGRLLLFGTGITRASRDPLAQQAHAMAGLLDTMRDQVVCVDAAAEACQHHRMATFGGLLHATWERKRTLPGVTNVRIDAAYAAARNAGALGGKLCGAGGGGYLLLFVEPDAQTSVRQALAACAMPELVFRLTTDGAQVVRDDVVG